MKVGLNPVCRISTHLLIPNCWLLCAFALLNVSLPNTTYAQNKLWDKTLGGDYSDELYSVQQTSDGGYILGGSSYSNVSGDKTEPNKGRFNHDYWIVKLKADGTKAWDRTIGGADADYLYEIQQTKDGGYILGGFSRSGISGDKTEANRDTADYKGDYWIVKINANGVIQWDKTFGGYGYDDFTSLQQTNDGGYILGGSSDSGKSGDKSEVGNGGQTEFGDLNNDYWVVKITKDGTKEWDRTIGGKGNDGLVAVQQTNEGNFVLGGFSNSGISGDKSQAFKGSYDYWIVQLNAKGDKIWDRTLGGDYFDILQTFEKTQDGGYILGGASNSSRSGDKSEAPKGKKDETGVVLTADFWVVKITADGTKVWDRTLGGKEDDVLSSLKQTRDGGYILGGDSRSGIGGNKTEGNKGLDDYWLVKLQGDGTQIWDKTLGGSQMDNLRSLQQTSDGNYILGGYSYSSMSGDKSEAKRGGDYDTDYWVVKVEEGTPAPTAAWDKRYGGPSNDNLTVVIKTTDGGYLVGGYSPPGLSSDKTDFSRGKNDFWIVKTDNQGQRLWDRTYGEPENDYLNRIIQTQDGGYLLGGSTISALGSGKQPGTRDYYVEKIDALGNEEWTRIFGGQNDEELVKMVQLSTGEYMLAGHSNSVSGDKTPGGQNFWLVKLNKDGNQQIWDKTYGGNSDETLGSFTETQDGGFLLVGNSLSGKSGDKTQAGKGGSDFWLVRTDKDGNIIWDKTFGGSGQDKAYSIGRSHKDTFFISGTSNSGKEGDKSQASQGGTDYWMLKLDGSGRKLWDRTFGGSKDDELRASTYTDEGHYVLAGHSFSGASGDKSQESQGKSDYWVVEVDKEGNKVQDNRYGGREEEELRTVFQTRDGGLLLGGRSNSGVSGNRTQSSQGKTDYWLVKVAPETKPIVAVRETTMDVEQEVKAGSISLQVYPNPFSEQANINFTVPETQTATLKVYDSQGREVTTLFSGEAMANQLNRVVWLVEKQKGGMYLMQLQTAKTRITRKILLVK